MNLNSCEHPKRIFNKYSQEWQYVPCGKCNTCKRRKAQQWVERLNVERKCWKYCLFFTLTYADEHLPVLTQLGHHLVDLSHKHQAPSMNALSIDLKKWYQDSKLSDDEISSVHNFLEHNEVVPYLAPYDLQNFIKRLRKNLKNIIKHNYETYSEKDYHVRYYAIGEYGETYYRPHFHGLLFFSSEKEAAHIEEAIYKSWKFGIINSSFVAESNAAYLAYYLNSYVGLPKIYEHKDLRKFALFSKCPPIGTLYFDEAEVREIYDRASPQHFVDYVQQLSPVNAPVWRTYIDRLFPKLSGFSKLTHHDRVALYRAYERYVAKYPYFPQPSAVDFSDYIYRSYKSKKFSPLYLQVYDRYLDYILQVKDSDYISIIKRWYFVSARVCTQAAAFNVSVEDYVTQIETFYDNVDKLNLQKQYEFQDEYSKKYGSQSLVGIDRLWLETIIDIPAGDLTYQECLQLSSFGIDLDKWCSDDLSIRLAYQDTLLPEHQREYSNMMLDSLLYVKKHTKTKRKNEYLRTLENKKEFMANLPFDIY